MITIFYIAKPDVIKHIGWETENILPWYLAQMQNIKLSVYFTLTLFHTMFYRIVVQCSLSIRKFHRPQLRLMC